MNIIDINSFKITQVVKENIFTSSSKIEYLVANTGCGKTTYLASLNIKKIIAVPTIVALKDIKKAHPEASCYFSEDKNLFNENFIITTHSSLSSLSEKINPGEYTVIFDEAHNLVAAASISFRNEEYLEFVENINQWNKVILTSATPLSLNHENLQNIEYTWMRSTLRNQDYVLVHSEDKVNYILDNISGKSIIFLNSKNELGDLGFLQQALLAKYTKDEILVYNAARKENGEEMVSTNLVPDRVKVIITTSVFLESFNLNSNIDNLFVLSTLHPILLHQLANRTRRQAIGKVHIFQNKTHSVNMKAFDIKINAALRGLKAHVACLLESGIESKVIEKEIQDSNSYVGQKGFFKYCPDKKSIIVNHFAIDNRKFQEEAEIYAADNALLEKFLSKFNWSLKAIITHESKADKKEKKAFKEAAKSQADSDMENVLSKFDNLEAIEEFQPSNLMEKALQAKISYLIMEGIPYSTARTIMKNIGISDSKFYKVKETIQIDKDRKSIEDNLTKRFYSKFNIGDVLTSAEIFEKVKLFMKEEGSLKNRINLTKTGALDIFKKHFKIFRTKTPRDGKYIDVYKIKSITPLDNFLN